MGKGKSEASVLTASELLGTGELKPLEIPELSKNGKPGVVYLRQLSAGDVFEFLDASEASDGQRHKALLVLISKAIVNPEGEQLLTEGEADKLSRMSIAVFNRLAAAVTAMANITGGASVEGNA